MEKKYKIKYYTNKELHFGFHLFRMNVTIVAPQKKIEIIHEKQDYNKIFCIGFGKTGTTSLEKALHKLGIQTGDQAVAEMLTEDWSIKRTDRIINYCHTAKAFQDLPFGLPALYKELDKAFPNSKFILTIRDNEEQWYNSLVKFHTKLFSSDKSRHPNEEDLKNSTYRYKGFILDNHKNFYDFPNIPLYDKDFHVKRYLKHNSDIENYFKSRDEDLLVLNVSEKESFYKLGKFLGYNVDKNLEMPWENKT